MADQREYENWHMPEFGANQKSKIPTTEELEAIRQQAHQQGLAQGYQDGLAKGQAEINETKAQLLEIMQTLNEPLLAISEGIEQDMVELIKHLAFALFQQAYEASPEHLLNLVKKARAELLQPSMELIIHMHPQDALLLRQLATDNDLRNCHIVDDSQITRGGCEIITEAGKIDATLASRIDALLQTKDIENEP